MTNKLSTAIHAKSDIQYGLSGLRNLGNTCFMNSCMQIISHTHILNDFLNEKSDVDNKPSYMHKLSSQENIEEFNLLTEWDIVRKMLWKANCVVTPSGFFHCMKRLAAKQRMLSFTGYSQNDVSEFLRFIISSFHCGIQREVTMNISGTKKSSNDNMAMLCYEMFKNEYSKSYSEIIPMFYGVQLTLIKDVDSQPEGDQPGSIVSMRPEPCFILSLPIPKLNGSGDLSILDCIKEYCIPELLTGDNKWYNENLKVKQEVYKQHVFWSLPNVLIIDLKRFNKNGTKIQVPLQLEMNISMNPFMVGYNKDDAEYELYGVCNHSGNCSGGHYTAHIKCANKRWYLFNDTIVSEDRKFSGRDNVMGYTLFYRKV